MKKLTASVVMYSKKKKIGPVDGPIGKVSLIRSMTAGSFLKAGFIFTRSHYTYRFVKGHQPMDVFRMNVGIHDCSDYSYTIIFEIRQTNPAAP